VKTHRLALPIAFLALIAGCEGRDKYRQLPLRVFPCQKATISIGAGAEFHGSCFCTPERSEVIIATNIPGLASDDLFILDPIHQHVYFTEAKVYQVKDKYFLDPQGADLFNHLHEVLPLAKTVRFSERSDELANRGLGYGVKVQPDGSIRFPWAHQMDPISKRPMFYEVTIRAQGN
jgi:hypothetical protein